ncbi:MAG: helix-turn-helix transcriptional regulator [Flavobacteriaceae bacterium]|nr:helix-turn-helix transcriptional regulator [Flavobacteriaceae bacterium]
MKLKEFRDNKGLSKTQIAKLTGIKRANYSNYEFEKTQPKIEDLIKLADFHNVSMDQLIGRTNSNHIALALYPPLCQTVLKKVTKLNDMQLLRVDTFIDALTGAI